MNPVQIPDTNGFIIENGILISYVGNETEVVIPDEVHTINGKAFIQCSGIDSITSISIGPAVEKIAENAFDGATALGTINVSEKNENFIFSDGVLMATDGSICFTFKKDDITDAGEIVDVMHDIANTNYFIGKRFTFVYEGLKIIARCVKPLTVVEESSVIIETFSVFGQTFNIKNNRYGDGFYTNGEIVGSNGGITNFYLSENVFIYSKLSYSAGYTLIITQDNIYEWMNEIQNAQDNPVWYNTPFYLYNIADDGRVTYTRQPAKYAFYMFGDAYNYCMGFDEFALEEGDVTFSNGEMVHTPKKSYTAKEFFKMVKMPFDSEEFSKRIEYNKKHYEIAY